MGHVFSQNTASVLQIDPDITLVFLYFVANLLEKFIINTTIVDISMRTLNDTGRSENFIKGQLVDKLCLKIQVLKLSSVFIAPQ